jgi:hypothetical protein
VLWLRFFLDHFGTQLFLKEPIVWQNAADTMSEQQSEAKQSGQTLLGWWIGLAVLILLAFILNWLDNTTELLPSHDGILPTRLMIVGLSGLILGISLFVKSKNTDILRRVGHLHKEDSYTIALMHRSCRSGPSGSAMQQKTNDLRFIAHYTD